MITNKDIRVENGFLIINGDKYPIASQAEIDAVKDDIDDLGDTIGDITQTGVTGATVAAQIAALETGAIKVAAVSGKVDSTTADNTAIGGYRTVGQTTKSLSSFTGYPIGKTVVGWSLTAYGSNAAIQAVVNVGAGNVYLNSATSGTFTVEGFVFYID